MKRSDHGIVKNKQGEEQPETSNVRKPSIKPSPGNRCRAKRREIPSSAMRTKRRDPAWCRTTRAERRLDRRLRPNPHLEKTLPPVVAPS